MKNDRSRYSGHRFPPQIISYAVWLYHRFCLSFRDVEDLLAERGIIVSYEAIRLWCQKFGPDYARKLKRRQGRLGDMWYLDEVFIRINGQQQYLWRAVDQDGDVIDILGSAAPQPARRGTILSKAATRPRERTILHHYRQTQKLLGRDANDLIWCEPQHGTFANNRAEVSHQPTRQRERQMRRFKSAGQAQRFLSLHGVVQNLFRVGRHLLSSPNHRIWRSRSFAAWQTATAA